jgi:hypothetical protein
MIDYCQIFDEYCLLTQHRTQILGYLKHTQIKEILTFAYASHWFLVQEPVSVYPLVSVRMSMRMPVPGFA